VKCPACGSEDHTVAQIRPGPDGQVKRWRDCEQCQARWTSYERIEERTVREREGAKDE